MWGQEGRRAGTRVNRERAGGVRQERRQEVEFQNFAAFRNILQ